MSNCFRDPHNGSSSLEHVVYSYCPKPIYLGNLSTATIYLYINIVWSVFVIDFYRGHRTVFDEPRSPDPMDPVTRGRVRSGAAVVQPRKTSRDRVHSGGPHLGIPSCITSQRKGYIWHPCPASERQEVVPYVERVLYRHPWVSYCDTIL